MKLPDANLLIYAYDDQSPHHDAARIWFQQLMSGTESVGFTWNVLLAFVRISTRAQVFMNAFKPEEALGLVESWLAQPSALILQPTDRHIGILRGLIESVGTAGNLTSDAHLAAIAIEYGGEVCSADTDFARFRGLRWSNPLL